MPLRLTWLLLAVLTLSGTGCARRLIQATSAQRDASFAAYANVKIGDVPVAKYLSHRSAILVRADKGKLSESTPNSGTFEFNSKAPAGIDLATATAIDPRGYFLTAAHCIEHGAPFLVFFTGGKVQMKPSRIVWRGQPSRGEPDLALLHASASLDRYFDWASQFKDKEEVLAAGIGIDNPRNLQMQCEAGKLLRFSERAAPLPSITRLFHDVPLRFGDSGGPLTNREGRLLGINVTIEGDYHPLKFAYVERSGTALRPDLAWLQGMIGQDQAKLSGKLAR